MNEKFEAFLTQLADFTNLKENNKELFSLQVKSTQPKILDCKQYQSKNLYKTTQQTQQIDWNNNAKLILQFKNMKEKIKLLTKQNNQLKSYYNSIEKQIQNKFVNQIIFLQDRDVHNMAALNFLKKQFEQINKGIDDLKNKNSLLEKQVLQKRKMEQQFEYFKMMFIQLKHSNERIKKQNNRINEISIQQKIQNQQKIKNMNLMKEGDKQYIIQLQIELNKIKEKYLSMESKYRKLNNQYQQTKFDSQKIITCNNKQNDLQKLMQQIQKQRDHLKSLLNQQKQKRLKAQSKIIQTQQSNFIHQLQIQNLEKQIQQLTQKNKKIAIKCGDKETKVQKEAYKNIQSKSKLYKVMQIFDQLSRRIKKELTIPQDILQYIKSCQYKISKIKQQQQKNNNTRSKSKNQKIKQKSIKKKSNLKLEPILDGKANENNIKQEPYSTPKYCNEIKKQINQTTQQKIENKVKQFTEEEYSFLDEDIDKKVKRQRQQKQKKIRQNLLYKKLQNSYQESEKYNIRQEIVKLNKFI